MLRRRSEAGSGSSRQGWGRRVLTFVFPCSTQIIIHTLHPHQPRNASYCSESVSVLHTCTFTELYTVFSYPRNALVAFVLQMAIAAVQSAMNLEGKIVHPFFSKPSSMRVFPVNSQLAYPAKQTISPVNNRQRATYQSTIHTMMRNAPPQVLNRAKSERNVREVPTAEGTREQAVLSRRLRHH